MLAVGVLWMLEGLSAPRIVQSVGETGRAGGPPVNGNGLIRRHTRDRTDRAVQERDRHGYCSDLAEAKV